LYLSDAEGTNFDGSYRYPSRFIFNTDKQYVNYIVELEERLTVQSTDYIRVNESRISQERMAFEPGDEVLHKAFGKGKIVAVKTELSSYVIKFDTMETVRNINMRTPLQKV